MTQLKQTICDMTIRTSYIISISYDKLDIPGVIYVREMNVDLGMDK